MARDGADTELYRGTSLIRNQAYRGASLIRNWPQMARDGADAELCSCATSSSPTLQTSRLYLLQVRRLPLHILKGCFPIGRLSIGVLSENNLFIFRCILQVIFYFLYYRAPRFRATSRTNPRKTGNPQSKINRFI